jgi:hypothetical protein
MRPCEDKCEKFKEIQALVVRSNKLSSKHGEFRKLYVEGCLTTTDKECKKKLMDSRGLTELSCTKYKTGTTSGLVDLPSDFKDG